MCHFMLEGNDFQNVCTFSECRRQTKRDWWPGKINKQTNNQSKSNQIKKKQIVKD